MKEGEKLKDTHFFWAAFRFDFSTPEFCHTSRYVILYNKFFLVLH